MECIEGLAKSSSPTQCVHVARSSPFLTGSFSKSEESLNSTKTTTSATPALSLTFTHQKKNKKQYKTVEWPTITVTITATPNNKSRYHLKHFKKELDTQRVVCRLSLLERQFQHQIAKLLQTVMAVCACVFLLWERRRNPHRLHCHFLRHSFLVLFLARLHLCQQTNLPSVNLCVGPFLFLFFGVSFSLLLCQKSS